VIGIIDLTGMRNLTGHPVPVSAADGDNTTGWLVWKTLQPDPDPPQELPAQDRYRVVRYLVTPEMAARYPDRWDVWVESDATHSPSGELTHHRGIARAYPQAAAPSLFGRRRSGP
jgi:hypothetical protein